MTRERVTSPKGRVREVAWPGPRGQAKWSVGTFLLHIFSGINKIVSIPEAMGVVPCVIRAACRSSISSNRNCPAQSAASADSAGSLVCSVRPHVPTLPRLTGASRTPDSRVPALSPQCLLQGLTWKSLPNKQLGQFDSRSFSAYSWELTKLSSHWQ